MKLGICHPRKNFKRMKALGNERPVLGIANAKEIKKA